MMIMELLEQKRVMEKSSYGEAVRLSNELREKPQRLGRDFLDNIIVIPRKTGFDIETATYQQLLSWLENKTIKKSESLSMFVLRVIIMRFPTKKNILKLKLHPKDRNELELISRNNKINVEFLGDVGYFNKVRLDGKLNIKPKVVKIK